ncbi:MAG: alpha/beta hydrolase fold protein [Acidobacteria bacterium]|nr:alpha/beta hydrolase fold protein [Acidobacteriota bacterium]
MRSTSASTCSKDFYSVVALAEAREPTMTPGRYDIFERRGEAGVLLAHGITGAPTEMKPLVRKLAAAGFTVACPQLSGHCSTLTELKQTRWTDWYATLEASLQTLREQCATVFVSGLSMGALLALKLAADHPGQVDGVATLSATFFYDGWNVPRFRQRYLLPLAMHSPLRYFWSYHEPSPYGIKDERIRNIIAAVYASDTTKMPEKYGYSEFPGVTIRETFRLIKAVKRDLKRVVAPLLVVHATEDDMASIENATFLAARVASSEVETFFVDDTYHVLTLDRRKDEVADRVAAFFRRHANGGMGHVPADVNPRSSEIHHAHDD